MFQTTGQILLSETVDTEGIDVFVRDKILRAYNVKPKYLYDFIWVTMHTDNKDTTQVDYFIV